MNAQLSPTPADNPPSVDRAPPPLRPVLERITTFAAHAKDPSAGPMSLTPADIVTLLQHLQQRTNLARQAHHARQYRALLDECADALSTASKALALSERTTAAERALSREQCLSLYWRTRSALHGIDNPQ